MTFPVRYDVEATDGSARTGTAHTARGPYTTPCFMPVGTRGAIKYLSAQDYEELGARIVLGNTYHLMLRPGAETVAEFGGLGRFAGWNGLTLTDSGGFQVFSLEPKVDDDGVTFRSTYDGSTHRFTPELAVHTQELLGADIQMVLDVCPPLPSERPVIELAVARTSAWAERARAAHRRRSIHLRDRPGRHGSRPPSGECHLDGRAGLPTATESVDCPSVRPGRRWSTPWWRRCRTCRPTGPAT
ncbi:MAG: tRNA guanosine(34) transglycosylase Tgt [Ilumatobacteraceae bacterium]